MMKKDLLLIICLFLVFCKDNFNPQNSKDTIAVVGSFYITKSDLENELKNIDETIEEPESLSRIFDSLIEETLLLNEFFFKNVSNKVSPLGEYSDSKKRKEAISILLEENVYSKIEIDSKEVETYYNENQNKFKKNEGFLKIQIIVRVSRLKDY